jgi:hypothetical protein
MSDLGNNHIGAGTTSDTPAGYLIMYGPFTAGASGNISVLNAYLAIAAGVKIVGAVYADSAGVPGARLGVSSEVTSADGTAQWWALTLGASVSIASGSSYWLGFTTSSNVVRYYDSGSQSDKYEFVGSYPGTTWPDPYGTPSGTESGSTGSIYATIVPAGPAAPSSLAVASVTSSSVNLTWDDAASVASGATGFTLEYDTVSTFDLGPTDIDIHIDDTETDTVMALAASTTYYFRVRAYNGSGNSAWSNTASGTTAAPPETTPPVVDSASVDSFGTTLTVELFEANSPPVLPASGVTGFTLTASGGAVTLSSAAISGTEYTATLSRAVTMNESLSLAYAPGNVTDSASPPNAMASFSGFPVANFSSIPDVAGSGKRASVGSPGVSSGGTRVGKSRIKIGG